MLFYHQTSVRERDRKEGKDIPVPGEQLSLEEMLMDQDTSKHFCPQQELLPWIAQMPGGLDLSIFMMWKNVKEFNPEHNIFL